MTRVNGPLAVVLVASLKNEPRGYQRQSGAERPNPQLLEVEAVPPGAGGESRRVVAPDEVEPVPGPLPVDEGGRALGGVVRQKGVQVAPVPVPGGAVQLRRR